MKYEITISLKLMDINNLGRSIFPIKRLYYEKY